MRHLVSTLITIILVLFSLPVFGEELELDLDFSSGTRNRKVLILNSALAATILTWGAVNWGYGEKNPHAESEGWFGRNTIEGGADKLGHMYTGYVLTHGSATLYRDWGISREKASLYGAGTSLMVTGLMELGDSFSNYGFSYEDMIANSLGAALGYYLYRYPDLRRKIDLRWEYKPDFNHLKSDFVTDYEHSKYLVAVKADGFDSVKSEWLKPFELHIGYYTRNYEDYDPLLPDERERNFYIGIGINVTRLIRPLSRTLLFNYLQMPYTYVEMTKELD